VIKWTFLLSLFVTATSFASGSHPPGSGGDTSFQIRKYESETLPNGLTILWLKDQALPYIGLQMMIKSGSSQDAPGKEGTAGFTASMLEKGTLKRPALKISEDLEQIGSDFSVDVQPDYTMAGTSSLSFNKDNLLAQFGEILLTPSFPHAELERHRKQVLAGLMKLADRPDDFTEYLLPHFMFGMHPYGHESSGVPKSIRGLKKFDLQQFYTANFTPGNSMLAVVGQYDDSWKQNVKDVFGKWKSKSSKGKEIPEFPQWKGTELLLVDRADLNQAQIQIGFKGVPRNIPEYLELRAALKVLGESFGSRLFEEIREKRGLTYHIHAWFDPRLKSGPMGIYTFTRLEKIGETVEETLKTYRSFVSQGVTDEEVSEVKALMRGQFPRTFETPEALAKQVLLLNLYGVSVDYLRDYLPNVDRMTKESINKSIAKYFDPTNLKILVYAPRDKAETTLKKLGKLEIKGYKEFLN
jgi:zinc protease